LQYILQGFMGALKQLREPLGRAIVGWVLLVPVLFGVLYVISIKPSHCISAKYGGVEIKMCVGGATPRCARPVNPSSTKRG
jgi:hypothetical protein